MGLSLEFYAGDAATIGEDFAAIEFDGLRDGTRANAYADFSLHLVATDLDILSALIAERVGSDSMSLSNSLAVTVGTFEGEGGAALVNQAWVHMVSSVNAATAPELAAEWMKRVGMECGEHLEVTSDAVCAVRDLINLCQLATRGDLDVVHAWYL